MSASACTGSASASTSVASSGTVATAGTGRGRTCLHRGLAYEKGIASRLASMRWTADGSPLELCAPSTAGASHGNDITFNFQGKNIGLELKNRRALEAGQRALRVLYKPCSSEPYLGLLDTPENAIHAAAFATLPEGYRPFGGRIPSFKLMTDKAAAAAAWNAEKHLFRGEHFYYPDSDTIARYYREKGASYIQLEGYGLFHTGEDPCNFGVPLFRCTLRVRIRCKQHGSSPTPSSVQISLNMVKRTIRPSPYCLEGALPAALIATTTNTNEPVEAMQGVKRPCTEPEDSENSCTWASLQPSKKKAL